MENKNKNNSNPQLDSSLKNNKWLTSILVLILLVLTTFIVFGNFSKKNEGLPTYTQINSEVKEAYLFATENPEALNGINCHCGCMRMVHDGRIHNRGLLDCFKRENGDYDNHAANCAMCITDTLQVKKMLIDNKTKEEIIQAIDNKYL